MARRPSGAGTLVYDGDCGFCRRSVQWARRRDRRGLTYVPFQRADLPPAARARAEKTILFVGKRTHEESAAAVRVLWSMHPGWKAAGTLLWLVPKPLRDLGYRFVARKWGPLPRG